MSKIALAMICKGEGDEPEILRRCLESVAPHVDGIFITLTGDPTKLAQAEEVCREYKANISYSRALWTADQATVDWLKGFLGYEPHMKVGDEIFLFDEARNFNFAQVPPEYEWILWLDSDDVLRRGENLHKVVDLVTPHNVEAVYFNYLYQVEIAGEFCVTCNQKVPVHEREIRHTIIDHLRERLIRNNGHYKWIAPIHETLIEQVPTNKTDNYDCDVVHLATMDDRQRSLTRNLRNLELAIYRTEGKDPRHTYYLAKAFFDIRQHEYDEKAVPLIQQYLYGEHKSGWPEERAQACEYLAEIYRRLGQFNNAVKAALNGLVESPENASLFLSLAITYTCRKEWERALFWAKLASEVPDKKTTLVRNPRDFQGAMLEVLYNCCLQLGRIDDAWGAAQKMFELFPSPQTKGMYDFISGLREQRDVTKKVVELADYLKRTGEIGKIKSLVSSAPRISEETPFVIQLAQQHNPPTYWGPRSIVIYCGPGFTPWSPKRLTDPQASFVGGSEEAVIHMSRQLARLGWEVTVYADPGADEGVIDGVTWLPYYKLNKQDRFNILLIWRQVGYLDQEINAKKVYVWCHDIQNPGEWNEQRTAKLTKAFFLSNWHRENVPALPAEKVMVTTNGI